VALAQNGADVVVNARSSGDEIEALEREVKADYGVRAVPVVADVSYREGCEKVVSAAQNAFGGIDIMVNNVGISPMMPLLEMTEEDWRTVLRVDLESVFHGTRAVLPGMMERGWGRIVNIVGHVHLRGDANRSHSAAAKGAVVGFSRSVSTEFTAHGITVNCIGPGHMNTEERVRYYRDRLNDLEGGQIAERERWAGTRIPQGRLGPPEEIGHLCAFLCSDAASYITGQTILVNGGMWCS
jgi:NAD(P)-dependent dehydrogenase (short-subunit alcohol dehydrogenase family)